MKEWTFLLQKYGDRSWLPLDSPDMEIREGRYRIVVQTDHANTDINVRVCHLATTEDPPKRRIQKRTNRTNANGLMVVSPFTHLPSGNWELCCFLSDPMSDLVGDVLHHAVRLRVTAAADADCQGWDAPTAIESAMVTTDTSAMPDFKATPALETALSDPEVAPSVQEMAALNVEIAQALGVSMDRLVAMTDHLSHQLIEEIFKEFNLNPTLASTAIAPEAGSATVTPELPPPSTLDVNQLRIVLAQDGWSAARGEVLAIAGALEYMPASELAAASNLAKHDSQQLETELEGAIPQELQIQLRDPQTSQVLFQACQSFPTGIPPQPFQFLCRLPDDLTTHLLLGEVMIAGVLPGAESVLVTLKTLSFTVTVDPQGLVAEFQKVQSALSAQSAEQAELLEVVAQFSERLQKEKERQTLDLSFLNMAAPVPDAMMQGAGDAIAPVPSASPAPTRKQILPPLLHQPDAEQVGKRKLELPVFAGVGASVGRQEPAAIAPPPLPAPDLVFGDAEGAGQSMVLPDLPNFSEQPAVITPTRAIGPETHTAETLPPAAPTLAKPGDDASPAAKALAGQADLARIDELSSPIRSAFQALNLQDKFLTRLSSMAADPELTTLLKLTLPQTEAPENEGSEPVAVGVAAAAVAERMAEPESTEIVVDEDPAWREWVKRAGSRPPAVEVRSDSPLVNPLVLPADQPIPLPTLELGIDEIVAGKPINIRVKLPNVLPKIYVKLWVNDRQTRTLLDGPRWLVDFLPNGFDELEAATQITAPFDSLNIRLEAIAVEMQTQRESQKVSLDCEVTPADLPDDLFDVDFESF